VHHPDDREPVDSTELPYRCIGQLMIYYPDGTAAQSTAFLVGPEHILTAADGFVGPAGLRKFDQAVFTPSLHGDQKPYGSASVVKVAIPETFVEACDQVALDIAVASLDRRIGDEAGYLAFDFAIAAHEATGAVVTSAGYATDTGAATMVRAAGRIERNGYPDVWWHDLDAAPGQNGSPLWIERNGEAIVIGVYVRGVGRHSYAAGPALKHDDVAKLLD
jgi:V8-like Glu-specific endopeptidase